VPNPPDYACITHRQKQKEGVMDEEIEGKSDPKNISDIFHTERTKPTITTLP
jgi:hypothetical protein